MRIARTYGLLAMFACVAVGLVHIRSEQTRSAALLLETESAWVRCRREQWTVQTRIARLRSPQQLRDRLERFKSDLAPPGSRDTLTRSSRLVTGQD